jgi:hypothetical protein
MTNRGATISVTSDSRRISAAGGRRWRALALLLALVGLLATVPETAVSAHGAAPASRRASDHPTCSVAAADEFRCFSTWRGSGSQAAGGRHSAAVTKPESGLRPADIRAAYRLPQSGAANQTIAIVDAFDNPNVEQDLRVYRAAFGLPACTTANKCFRKVDQRGGTRYPEGEPGWGVEIALDVQAVSAACSSCKILLVEADEPTGEALGEAVATAVRLGADVVSNSYGGLEYGSMIELGKKYFTHPGVPILAATGDSGFTSAAFPAVLASTWAIGGTLLKSTKAGGWTEDAWEGAGSGCSAYIEKPRVQQDKNCQMRSVADVSAVANSSEGFAVYDTYGLDEANGWIAVGGTSLSTPLIAGMIGLAGNAATVADPSWLYTHRSGLKDVVGGSNGFCGGDYLCTGVKGYDGPTGLGSPRGLKSM